MRTIYRFFGRGEMPEGKEVGKAVKAGRRRAQARFASVLIALAILLPLLQGREARAQFTVIASIPVGTGPTGVAVNPTTNRIYVTNGGSNDISVIDGATNTVVATIPVVTSPQGVGVNPNTNKVYVSQAGSPGTVSVIDGATNTVLTTISSPPAEALFSVGVNPNTNLIYVTSFDPGGRVLVIDGASDTVSAVLSVAANPVSVGVNPATNKIYVGHGTFFGRTLITLIDGATNAVSDCTDVGLSHVSIAVNPTTDRIYVTRALFDTVALFDGACNPLIASIPVGDAPVGVGVIQPNPNRIYVANSAADTVSVIDGATNAVIGPPLPVGDQPSGVGVNPSTRRVYVANYLSNTVSVIEDLVFAQDTNQWHHVAAACVPDDTTRQNMYRALDGFVEYKGMTLADISFWCNVVSPHEDVAENPLWTEMGVTFKDPDGPGLSSQVNASLFQKDLNTGVTGLKANFDSNLFPLVAGVHRESVGVTGAFDFNTFSYYVLIRLHRATTPDDPEAHIVSLRLP